MVVYLLIGAMVVGLAVMVFAFLYWRSMKEAEAIERESQRRKQAMVLVEPTLNAHASGMTVGEVTAATGLRREDVFLALRWMVDTRAAYIEQSQDGMVLVTRYRPEFPSAPAPPGPAVPSIGASAATPPAREPGLPPRWLDVRKQIVQSTDLEEVSDIVHPFYVCAACGAETTSVVMLAGSILADAAAFRATLETFGRDPGVLSVQPVASCGCGAQATLDRAVVCRTSPRFGHDLHVTLYPPAGTPRLSTLARDGQYAHLPNDAYAKHFGAPG